MNEVLFKQNCRKFSRFFIKPNIYIVSCYFIKISCFDTMKFIVKKELKLSKIK